MSTVPIPAQEVRDTWVTIADVCAHYKVSQEEWRKIANALGDVEFNDLGMLVGVSDEDFAEARDAAGLTPLKRGALNLVFGVSKIMFGIHTSVIKYVTSELTGGQSVAPSAAERKQEGEAREHSAGQTTLALTAKVRVAQILNQAVDQEVPMLSEIKLAELRKYFIDVIGDEPLQKVDATDAQITALNFVVECGLAPYADFGVFGPHGVRQEKRMRFAQHFQDSTGKWRAVEQPGPPNIESWRQCWETFTVAAVTLRIARPAVLARYAQKFEERCARYHRSWHLCVRADDRCRAEFWTSERRRQQRFSEAHPAMSAVEVDMPWNSVIKESADNLEFWLNELQEPALLYTQMRDDSTTAPTDWPRKWSKGKGKEGAKADQTKHLVNDKGQEICFKFNNKTCKWNECTRAHVCNLCLGAHPSAECPRKKKGGKKGKGKKGDSASSH